MFSSSWLDHLTINIKHYLDVKEKKNTFENWIKQLKFKNSKDTTLTFLRLYFSYQACDHFYSPDINYAEKFIVIIFLKPLII